MASVCAVTYVLSDYDQPCGLLGQGAASSLVCGTPDEDSRTAIVPLRARRSFRSSGTPSLRRGITNVARRGAKVVSRTSSAADAAFGSSDRRTFHAASTFEGAMTPSRDVARPRLVPAASVCRQSMLSLKRRSR
eukprot:scaffold5440_cov32-Tisochrysis_lutea.AAC.8